MYLLLEEVLLEVSPWYELGHQRHIPLLRARAHEEQHIRMAQPPQAFLVSSDIPKYRNTHV
jgi:hypothetical protein